MFSVTAARSGGRSFNESSRGYRPSYRGGRGRGRGRGLGPTPRSRLGAVDEDGDVEMSSESNRAQPRYNPYGGRGRDKKRGFKKQFGNSQSYLRPTFNANTDQRSALERLGLPVQASITPRSYTTQERSNWFKIKVPYGRDMGKDFILRSIREHCQTPFIPTHFHFENKVAVFFVQDNSVADAIQWVDKRVTAPSGYKMHIKKYPSPPPVQNPSDSLKLAIKQAMSGRYDTDTHALNLSDFANDSDLRNAGLHVPLNNIKMMSLVVDIMKDNIPHVLALDLSKNRITTLDPLSLLKKKDVTNLIGLNLGGNLIRSDMELDWIKGLPLKELILEKNPLCDRFKDQRTYISTIRKRFPKVTKLDGIDLPPPIGFDLDDTISIPKSQESHFTNDDVKTLVLRFLEEYFGVYDSEDRQSLLNAYHENAFFSLSVLKSARGSFIGDYLSLSRNLHRVPDIERRAKLLKQGRIRIVSFLSELPKTQHDPNSFSVDVSLCSPQMLSFTVTGVFKEPDRPSNPPIRAFSRCFIVVPVGEGICIVNEQLTINSATVEQIKTSFVSAAPTPSSSPIHSQTSSNSEVTSPVAGPSSSVEPLSTPLGAMTLTPPPQEQRAAMVRQFMIDSSMNEEWSTKCLLENEWNYERAGRVFTELNRSGSIPPEAFQQ